MLFASLAVVLGLGAAGVAGITALKETEKVEATIWRQNPTIYFIPSDNWVGDSATFKMNYYDNDAYKGKANATDTGNTYKSRKIYSFEVTDGSWVSAVQFLRFDSTGNSEWNYSGTFDISDNYDSDENTLFMTADSTSYSGWTAPADDILWTKQLTITKTAKEYNTSGTATGSTWSLGTEIALTNVSFPAPDAPNLNLEHFVGWYTNSGCTTSYSATTLSSNITLYAKLTLLELDSYFYWTDKGSGDMTNIYFFGDYCPTAWPGDSLSSFLVSSVMNFHSEGKLYRFPVPSSGSYKFVINSGNNNAKTGDTSVTLGSFLYTYWTENSGGTAWYGTSWNSNAAAAAEVAYLLETKRNAVTAGGGIAAYSICGISTSDANAILSGYNGLTADQKVYFDNTYTKTYDGADTSKEIDQVFFSDMIVQLTKNVSGKGAIQAMFLNTTTGSTSIVIVISMLLLAGAAAGGYFLLRKKRVHH